MSKFNRQDTTARNALTVTHEGGKAYVRDAKSELVLLAVVNMVGEDTFYESAEQRDNRYADLVHTVAVQDGAWMARFVAWLRDEAQMRSAALVAAAHAVFARLAENLHGDNRKIVDAACRRADEPGEFLAYWTATFGRTLPKPVKRGLADAVRRLYGEKALLKYDIDSHAFRFGDVLELTHAAPEPDKPWQGELFRHALDRRHGRGEQVPEVLPTVRARAELMAMPAADRQSVLTRPDGAETLARAGMTWEALAGWLQGPMDAAAWEAVLPSMGLMAQLRNLRNFDQAGVSDAAAQRVIDRLRDPLQIARSRQFPYRFLSAYRAAPSLRWAQALEEALAASTANVPALPGRTLLLVDASGSMQAAVSRRSTVTHADVGALFGATLAHRGERVEMYGFASGHFRHQLTEGGSVLPAIERFRSRLGEVGYGTETVAALRAAYKGHDRVVIVSDMQAFHHPGGGGRGVSVSEAVPADVPVFGVNTSGYAPSALDTSRPNRYEIGGFSDKLFTMMALLSEGEAARWPWERTGAMS
ncbi:TROVE domain-containing protein [Streptomyces sp. NBC_01795]|uniref:TROVE domain-containing protein n=1 Tax=unclassified Streptomyces TaxID=2593676 RepID=UPI002DD8E5D5|nr:MULTISPECIES: TROVE domain-containing protein [unclassified Streptomyces]WSA96194.1 TROVE domain-containing protein [Streptomyces sp. NBC_01795]WSS11183.1 TROVE domain-containing protein [Streptomyces sp. NBC_01186]